MQIVYGLCSLSSSDDEDCDVTDDNVGYPFLTTKTTGWLEFSPLIHKLCLSSIDVCPNL
ncbi:hypothetical protein DPMN_095565 [Dreissena polymorpha]|uniref:Uncharacterized protein n=1 Tax=Dreissena polymorpha TaxID=45954 RepID=A0A9D4L6Q3_DREPO|nr:hypothetical protein DPMN_095565 [Dreissena polymorpha]